MPETCKNWLGLVNNCIYYAHQTVKIYQVMRKCSFIWKKNLQIFEMTEKLKGTRNLLIAPEIFPWFFYIVPVNAT